MNDDFLMEPPTGLMKKIIMRIHKEERVLVLRRIILFSVTLIFSTLSFIPISNMLMSDFNQSGFLHFVSLAFSDFSVVTAYWQSFTITLLETLPAISLALFFAILLIFLESVKYLTKDVRTIIKAAV